MLNLAGFAILLVLLAGGAAIGAVNLDQSQVVNIDGSK